MKQIAIVGFGFCGRLALHHLVKKSDRNTRIVIFDSKGENSLGPAFSSFSPYYILNVPTRKMSAFSDAPQNFYEFLERKYPLVCKEVGKDGFAPRRIYGEYIEEFTKAALVEAEKKSIEVEFVFEEVASITKQEEVFSIKTKSSHIQAHEIFVATSFNQSDLPFNLTSQNVVKKLWDADSHKFHEKFFTDEKICLIGSGLTAVDVIVGLKNKNFRGKISVTSRRGNLPKKHFVQKTRIPDVIFNEDAKKGVLFLCLKIRKFLRDNPQFDLRQVVDSIRSNTTDLWHNFDEKNKKLFLRLMCYWNIFRHRAPISSIEIIEEMIKSGQVEIVKKGVKNVAEKNGKVLVETKEKEIECDYLVNCLGFEFRAEKYPLLDQMVKAGLLEKDLLLVRSKSKKIHLLGGLNIGKDFECTSVPDLRLGVEKELS